MIKIVSFEKGERRVTNLQNFNFNFDIFILLKLLVTTYLQYYLPSIEDYFAFLCALYFPLSRLHEISRRFQLLAVRVELER